MDGPAWNKVLELTKDYPPTFNAMAAHDLLLRAWQMGFDLVRDETGPQKYIADWTARNAAYQQATGYSLGLTNVAAMMNDLPK